MQELLLYLSTLLDSTKLSLYEDANRVMTLFGYQDHEHEITDLLNSAEDGEMVKILDSVNDILHVAFGNILLQHDMTVNGTLEDKVKITESLFSLTNWNEREILYDMSNVNDSPNFVLSDMLAHVSSYDRLFYLDCLEDVSHSLINRIRELYQPLETNAQDVNVKRLQIVRAYVKKYRDTWAEKLLVDFGVALELDIDIIFKIANDFLNNIKDLSDEDAAKQIVGLYLISNCQISNLNMIIKDDIDNIYPNPSDLGTMNRVYSCIQNLLMTEGYNG